MALNIIQDFIPTSLPTRSGRAINAKFITIHNTDNATAGAGAASHNKYIRGADAVKRKVSWHFTVDDKAIFQHLPIKERGLHAGTTAGNDQSIGVEICMNSDMNTAKAYASAAALVAHCVKALGVAFPGCMKQHNNWSGKNCPSRIRSGSPMTWQAFLALCQAEVNKLANQGFAAAPEVKVTKAEDAPAWEVEDEDAILASIGESMAEHHDEGEDDGGEKD